MANQASTGIALALSGAFLFSLKPILIKLAYAEGIEAAMLITLRMAFSLPFYLLVGLWFMLRGKAKPVKSWSLIIQIGLIGILGYYMASYLDLLGLKYISAQLERLILFAYPTLVIVLSALWFRQSITRKVVLALLLTYSGIACIVLRDGINMGPDIIKGATLVFASACCFAGFMLLSKAPIKAVGSPLFTCIAMTSASIVILCQFVLTQDIEQLLVSRQLLLIILAIAILSTVIPSFLINAAIARIGPGQTSIIGSIGPVITALLTVTVLGEGFTGYHALSLLLVIAGVYWVSVKPKL